MKNFSILLMEQSSGMALTLLCNICKNISKFITKYVSHSQYFSF